MGNLKTKLISGFKPLGARMGGVEFSFRHEGRSDLGV